MAGGSGAERKSERHDQKTKPLEFVGEDGIRKVRRTSGIQEAVNFLTRGVRPKNVITGDKDVKKGDRVSDEAVRFLRGEESRFGDRQIVELRGKSRKKN